MAKKKTTPSKAHDAADRKTTIYFASPEEKAEVERIGALMMPGMTPQMFLVAIARRQIREFQEAEKDGRIQVDEWGRRNIVSE